MTLVSIIIPTYRRNEELKNALFSLAKQTYKNIEILLIDDNGDDSWNLIVSKIVSDFKMKFPEINLRYLKNNPNLGSAKSRNIGIFESNGKYITFLDDDDIYLPNKVFNQLSFMEKNDFDYSVTDLYLYNEKDKEIDRRVRSYIINYDKNSIFQYHFKYHITGTDTMMFKKEYLLKIGGFAHIDVGDEFYLMQRAIEGDGKFGYLKGCDIKAYVHQGEKGLSSGKSKIIGENMLFEYKKKYFNILKQKDIRYIKMRHYSVIAYANLRSKHFFSFAINLIKSFFVSPISFILLLINRRSS